MKLLKQILFITFWGIISASVLVLLVASIQKQHQERCNGFEIEMLNKGYNLFINEKEVEQIVKSKINGEIKGALLANFDLSKLESILKQTSWISSSRLFFDANNYLHINISEREPVARLITKNNQSFYIDSTGMLMPLSEKVSARVLLFTNFTYANDSILLQKIKIIANTIKASSFWQAQLTQIDILPDNTFEAVPLVGNQIIKLGTAENLPDQLQKLMLVYQQVYPLTNLQKYSVFDLRFKDQIVAVKNLKGNAKDTLPSIKITKGIDNGFISDSIKNTSKQLIVKNINPTHKVPINIIHKLKTTKTKIP